MSFPKLHDHAALIDRLGGRTIVTQEVNKRLPTGEAPLGVTTISNWRKRGIPVWARTLFAGLLIDKGHKVPKGFTRSHRP